MSNDLFYILIISNVFSALALYLCAKRLLKFRRRQKRSFTFKSYPIQKCQLEDVHPCFIQDQLGPSPNSTVYFIGGEGVEASLSDRETWVVAALAKFSKRILNLAPVRKNFPYNGNECTKGRPRIYTPTIHPSQLEQLSFENNDDRLHENIAKEEAKFDIFYYSDLSTSEKIEQIFSDSKQFDESKFKNSFDLILIDGAHTRSYIMSDSKKAFSMLKREVSFFGTITSQNSGCFPYLNDLSSEMPLRHISYRFCYFSENFLKSLALKRNDFTRQD